MDLNFGLLVCTYYTMFAMVVVVASGFMPDSYWKRLGFVNSPAEKIFFVGLLAFIPVLNILATIYFVLLIFSGRSNW